MVEREQVSTLKHEHTHRYYLFRQLLSSDLERTIDGRCSAFVILTVFLVALAGGATVHRKWVGIEDWRLLHTISENCGRARSNWFGHPSI